MTREEAEEYAKEMTYRDAINNLMKARSIPYRKATFIKVNELLKALEQEPCDDAISREDVINLKWQGEASEEFLEGYANAIEDARVLPPVKPQEPKTGHWIAQDIHNCHTDFKCSECGYIHNFTHLYGEPTADYTYCPYCGARMVEPQESEEGEEE